MDCDREMHQKISELINIHKKIRMSSKDGEGRNAGGVGVGNKTQWRGKYGRN